MKPVVCVVPGCNVPLYNNGDGSYLITVGEKVGVNVDGDGRGGNTYHDPDFQPHTSYKPDCDADQDDYFVFPPIIFLSVPGWVMGCKASIKRLKTGQVNDVCFPGDVGPHVKVGEFSTHLSQFFDPRTNPNNGFEPEAFEITFWPGIAAEGRILQSFA